MKKALLQMHLAVLLWGFTGVLGLAISVDAPVLVWYRTLLTALFMAIIVTWRRTWVPVPRRDMWQLIVVGALMGIHWVCFYGAIKFANASIALVCLSTASVFTSLLDPLINKSKYDYREMLLGLLALLGVYLIYRTQLVFGKGIAFGVVAAILSSVFTVLNKRVAARYPARVMVFYEMSAGWVVVSLIIGVLIATNSAQYLIGGANTSGHLSLLPVGLDWLWLVVLSLCCTVWAQSLALTALKSLSSFTTTLSVNLEPIYGIILAFIFYQENQELSLGFYLGVALIILSVGLQMLLLLKPGTIKGWIKARGGVD